MAANLKNENGIEKDNLEPVPPDTLRKLLWVKKNWRKHPKLCFFGLAILALLFLGGPFAKEIFLSNFFKGGTKIESASFPKIEAEKKESAEKPKVAIKPQDQAKPDSSFSPSENIKQEVTGERNIVAGRDITISPGRPQDASKPQNRGTEEPQRIKSESIRPSENINQKVTGDRNIVAAGDITFLFYYLTGKEHFTEKMTAQEVKKKANELVMENLHKSPDEAEEWVEDFLDTLSARKERRQTQIDDKRKDSERDMKIVSAIFGFILKNFDEKIAALEKRIPSINSSVAKSPRLIAEYGSPDLKNSVIRKVNFPNKNSAAIIITPGSMKRGIVQKYPEMMFHGIIKKEGETLLRIYGPALPKGAGSIVMATSFPQIAYSVEGDFLNEEFRKIISKNLEDVFVNVL